MSSHPFLTHREAYAVVHRPNYFAKLLWLRSALSESLWYNVKMKCSPDLVTPHNCVSS